MATFIENPCERVGIDCPAAAVRPTKGTLVLAASILGSGMALLDGTAVNVILPVLQRELHANAQFVQWVVEGYALFSFGAHLGRRRVGRRVRPAKDVRGRNGALCGRIDRLRAGANDGTARLRALRARNRRGAARSGKFGAHQRTVRAEGAWKGDRHLGGLLRDKRRNWPRCWAA
jgi:hypothetical protein